MFVQQTCILSTHFLFLECVFNAGIILSLFAERKFMRTVSTLEIFYLNILLIMLFFAIRAVYH